MKLIVALLVLAGIVSLAPGQWVETIVPLPDSFPKLSELESFVFHSPNSALYVGGPESCLIVLDAVANAKLAAVAVGKGAHVLCSDPTGNKVYCSNSDSTITVIDGAANQPLKTFSVERPVTDLVYSRSENKLYCGNANDSLLRVIDCAGDSLVARVPVSPGPGRLCYNPRLNRVYCAHITTDEVSVVDCAADTLVAGIWVRGVQPTCLCYDSATNCVYVANKVSQTVSVIDCVTNTLARIVPVGVRPQVIIAGPPGKVYCGNYYGSSVSVITGAGVKAVRTCPDLSSLSYDPAHEKVYCASDYSNLITVIDAVEDTILDSIVTGPYGSSLVTCYNPAGNNTYGRSEHGKAAVIGGESDSIEKIIPLGWSSPEALCYNPANDHLYCLDPSNHLLLIIGCDSNRVLKTFSIRNSGSYVTDVMTLNAMYNKVYFTNYNDSLVSIIDCAQDSIVATLKTGQGPRSLCCGDDGKVYVAHEGGGVAVIDGSGDSVRSVVPIPDGLSVLCYDRTDRKVYVGNWYEDSVTVSAIDAEEDTVVATILLQRDFGYVEGICWNQEHDKVYACGALESVAVIDCVGDTILKNIYVSGALNRIYNDSVCDKVYLEDNGGGYLRIINARTDAWYKSMRNEGAYALLDNGRLGSANRLYCTTAGSDGPVTVIAGYNTDSVLRQIPVAAGVLAWNPVHSCMYAATSSSITVLRDTPVVGVEEWLSQVTGGKPAPTFVRSILFLPEAASREPQAASLLDAAGRKVLELHSGANDVRSLAPGVYFVREAQAQAQAQAQAVRKIVLTE